MRVFASTVFSLTLSAASAVAVAAPSPVAEYAFNNSFASSVSGAPALQEVNPLGTSGFGSDFVIDGVRNVYHFNGARANADQAGLSLDVAGLLASNSLYSVEIVFKFTESENAWRRIMDVQNRQSDNGFYVDPSNRLDIYPVAGGAPFSNDVYHDVFLSNDNGVVKFYLDGSAQASVTTSVMNIDSNNRLNFFLDNIVGGGQQEYSSGSVALIRLYDVAIAEGDIPTLPPIPEPSSWALLLAGLGVVGVITRRRVRAV